MSQQGVEQFRFRANRTWAGAVVVLPVFVPLASLLVAVTVLESGWRLLLMVALPALVLGAFAYRLPRGAEGGTAFLLGVLALASGLIARVDLLVVAGLLYLLAGIGRGWGVNRGRRRSRAWTNRGLAAVGAVLVGFFVVYPTLLVVDYLAKPRASINEAALALPHERITFAATDGVRLAGWYVRPRNGAAIVLVHGGGGDRQGTIRHARMLVKAGYGVLLYDASAAAAKAQATKMPSAGNGTATSAAPSPISPDVESAVSGFLACQPVPKQSSLRQHPTLA